MALRTAFHVRPALPNDWTGMFYCFRDAARKGWTDFLPKEILQFLEPPARWKDAIYSRDPGTSVLVVESEGGVVAFAVIQKATDSDATYSTGEIDAFYTDPKYWGCGAGQSLMEQALGALKAARLSSVTLWTEARNHRARRFYELAGFRLDGEVRKREWHGQSLTELRYRIEL